jgi:hypothetical protein
MYKANPEGRKGLNVMGNKGYTQNWRYYFYYYGATLCPSLRGMKP